ncbi:MAG: hypothetical protein DI598_15410, partial [Pseudopedobacter saltans]
MKGFHVFTIVLILFGSIFFGSDASAQVDIPAGTNTSNVTYDSQGRPIKKTDQSGDTLKHRDGSEDSISISFRY